MPNVLQSFEPRFSLFYDLYRTNELREVSIRQLIKIMTGETLKDLTIRIRTAHEQGDKKLKERLKAQLPLITHTGCFNPRSNDGFKGPSFTYQLDIDHAENPGAILNKVIQDNSLHVLLATISASGRGVKALLLIEDKINTFRDFTVDEYRALIRDYHDRMTEYFKIFYECDIDQQMKAISQPFFLFHSPDLWVQSKYK